MNRDLVILAVGRLLQIVVGLASVKVLTALLSTAEVGNLYLINALFGFFGLALISPIGQYVNRGTHRWHENKVLMSHFALFRFYLVAVAVLSTLLIIIARRYFGVGQAIPLSSLIAVIMLSIYIIAWNQTVIPVMNMLHHRISFVVFTVLSLVIGLVFSAACVYFFFPTAISWLSGQLAALALVSLMAARHFKRLTNDHVDRSYLRHAISVQNIRAVVSFCAPLSMTMLFMWLQYQSYRIIIERSLGLEFLGMIGLGLAIASNIAGAAESLVQQLLYPSFYQSINTSDPRKRGEAWNAMAQSALPVYLALTIMTSCLAPQLMRILASGHFLAASRFLVYGAWIELFRMATNALSTIAHSEMQTRHLLKAYLVGGLLAAAGTAIAARTALYENAVPLVLVISGLVTLGIMAYDMSRLIRIAIDFRSLRRSLLSSAPYALALFVPADRFGVSVAAATAAGFGLYFVITQYWLFNRPSGGLPNDA